MFLVKRVKAWLHCVTFPCFSVNDGVSCLRGSGDRKKEAAWSVLSREPRTPATLSERSRY